MGASESKIRTRSIGSLTEYVCNITQDCEAKYVLFRGQPDGEDLLPAIGRRSGPSNPLEVEKHLLREIEWRARPFLEFEPRNTLEWLQVGRHYRMTTRLLDWTSSALAALWFAVAATREGEDGAVWVFRYDKGDVLEGENIDAIAPPRDKKEREEAGTLKGIKDLSRISRTCVLRPRHIDRRIAAQASCFTLHAYDSRFTPLDRDPWHVEKLRKLVVKKACFARMRQELHLLGVNEATLFPDIGGLCAHLNRQYCGPRGEGSTA